MISFIKNYKLFLLVIVSVVLNSCCKDKNTYTSGCQKEPAKYLGDYPLGEIKDYLYFHPGSQWVYECDSTLELDTQIMTECVITPYKKPYITYELLTFKKISINEGSTYKVFYPTTNVPYNDDFKYFFSTVIKRTNPKDPQVSRDCIYYKPYDSSIYGFGSSETRYHGYLDSLEVLGKWYKDIRIFQVAHSAGFAEPTNIGTTQTGQATYYWAKNIGIVRLHIWTAKRGLNTTFKFNWNLKSHQVTQ